MKTKRPLPKRLSGTKRVSGILLGLLALALVVASAASAAPFAFVSNFASGNVSVIDGATNSVVATIPVGAMPSGVAVNGTGTRAYVANSGDDSISVIDLTTNPPSVITIVPDGSMPTGVAVSADGTRVYVASLGGGLTVIDAGTNTPLSTTPTGSGLSGFIAVNPVTPRVYLTDAGNITGSVIVTDATGALVASFNVGSANSSPLGLAVDSSGARLYVANTDGTVSVIDTALIGTSTNPVIASVPVGPTALQGIAVSPTTGRVYVANQGGGANDCGGVPCGSVAVISGTAIIATVTVGTNPYGVATDPSGARVFVGNADDGTTSVIDTATNTVVATVPVGLAPLVFGSFVAGAPQNGPPSDPPSDPPSCDGKIAELQKKVSKLGRHHGPAWLKAALYARGAAEYELKLAKRKVGDQDSRYLRAVKEFKNGDAKLCAGRYWRAKHEYWDAFDIAHKILRRHWHHRR